jgi:hypothetical protein
MKSTAIVNTVVSVATRDVYFPDKLHKVLVDLEVSGLSHIASYLPHGRAFRVHKPREFVSSVLPL